MTSAKTLTREYLMGKPLEKGQAVCGISTSKLIKIVV